jgi:spectinomycin phosphotransferase
MLEKPALPDRRILEEVRRAFGLEATKLNFLPLGADVNTAVYWLVDDSGETYFLKLRSGPFSEITLTVPLWLHSQGLQAIIPPLKTRPGGLWGEAAQYKLILYPFVEGKDGYQVKLTPEHWLELGQALRHIHLARLPETLRSQVPEEDYTGIYREQVRRFQEQVQRRSYHDPVAQEMAALMREKEAEMTRRWSGRNS